MLVRIRFADQVREGAALVNGLRFCRVLSAWSTPSGRRKVKVRWSDGRCGVFAMQDVKDYFQLAE